MGNGKDLRYVRTNQMLCSAFIELLSKKKFESITINELCEKACIRRATFYTHFLDKYDFFAYFIRQNRDNFVASWTEPEEDKTLFDFSIHMFRQIVRYFTTHMAMVKNALNSNAFSILLDILAEEIQVSFLNELSKSGQEALLGEILPEVAASYYAGGIIQILRCWITSKNAISEDALVKQYAALLKTFLV